MKKTIVSIIFCLVLLTPFAVSFFMKRDVYKDFSAEVYDSIQKNYWEKLDDEKLSNIYLLAINKLSNKTHVLSKFSRDGVLSLIGSLTRSMKPQEKKRFVTEMSDMVLANLSPFGRSRLYTQKLEKQLRETVANIDRSVNLYDALGVDKTASKSAIAMAVQTKKRELEQEASPEAKQKLAQIERAHQALSQEDRRARYDAQGIEPTLLISYPQPDVAYINLKKFSPTSYEELSKAFSTEVDPQKYWVILDMRGNMGGSIDMLQFLLGPFIGTNQIGYEFYHQGDYLPFRTKTARVGELGLVRKLIVLVDSNTQSSAELMAAVLKKYNVAIVVGSTTKGWGTVENVFPIKTQIDPNEQYSLFLVHSITIRDDGQPIEGRGVEPHILVSDPNWKSSLFRYIPSSSVIATIANALQ